MVVVLFGVGTLHKKLGIGCNLVTILSFVVMLLSHTFLIFHRADSFFPDLLPPLFDTR